MGTQKRMQWEGEGLGFEDTQMQTSAECIRCFALSLFIQKAIFVH